MTPEATFGSLAGDQLVLAVAALHMDDDPNANMLRLVASLNWKARLVRAESTAGSRYRSEEGVFELESIASFAESFAASADSLDESLC